MPRSPQTQLTRQFVRSAPRCRPGRRPQEVGPAPKAPPHLTSHRLRDGLSCSQPDVAFVAFGDVVAPDVELEPPDPEPPAPPSTWSYRD